MLGHRSVSQVSLDFVVYSASNGASLPSEELDRASITTCDRLFAVLADTHLLEAKDVPLHFEDSTMNDDGRPEKAAAESFRIQ